MSVWAIRNSYNFQPFEVIKETERFVLYKEGGRECRSQKIAGVRISIFSGSGFLPWRGTEHDARKLAEKLTSIKAEHEKRRRDADAYMERECSKLLGE